MKSKANALYVHIPFCRNLCTYCDFRKFIYNQKLVDEYFKSLFLDLDKYSNNKYKTIYIGGGTPSCINKVNLEKLLNRLSAMLDDKYQEFTIECNVEDINDTFLQLIKSNKINRLSIGVQSFNDDIIKYCNRHHNKKMAIDNINIASKYIDNISIDLIYAFQNQTISDIKNDIDIAMSLPIKHLSYYSLLIEPNTLLYAKKVENVDDNVQAKMYKYIYNRLKSHHFHRYEISNFAKYKKYESKHNKVYWENKHYDAVGLSSSGYVNNIRFTNNMDLFKYNKNDFTLSDKIILSEDDIMFEQIMLNLRLDKGLDINKFNRKYKVDFKEKYNDAIKFNLNNKLITIKNGILKTTFKGSLLLNDVLEKFL